MYREMEQSHELDPDSEIDMFCLHYVFMPMLKEEMKQFSLSWNRHGLRTESNLTPLQLFIGGSIISQQPLPNEAFEHLVSVILVCIDIICYSLGFLVICKNMGKI